MSATKKQFPWSQSGGEEHDRLIRSLDDPAEAVPVRRATEARKVSHRLNTAEAAMQVIFGPTAVKLDKINLNDLPRAAKIAIQMDEKCPQDRHRQRSLQKQRPEDRRDRIGA